MKKFFLLLIIILMPFIASAQTVEVDTDVNNCIDVTFGGTNANSAAGARTNLGVVIGTDVLAPAGSGASLTDIPLDSDFGSNGIMERTGAGTYGIATEGADYYAPGGTDVAVADGGTGASTAADAKTNLLIDTATTFAFTTEGDITDPITSNVVLLDGDDDSDSDTIDLQDGTSAGQRVTFIAYADIDSNDTVTISMGDTTATFSTPIVFTDLGQMVTLVWDGTSWNMPSGSSGVYSPARYNVVDYGATPNDASDDDSTAITAAITAASADFGATVYFPSGVYHISNPIVAAGSGTLIVNLVGESPYSSRIYTTANITMLDMQVDTAHIIYSSVRNLAFVAPVSGTRTSSVGIEVSSGGGTTTNFFNCNLFENLIFSGTYIGIYVTKDSYGPSYPGEMLMGYNKFTHLTFNNSSNPLPSGNNHAYCIRYLNGPGVGHTYDNNFYQFDTAGISWGCNHSPGNVAGDMIISNSHFCSYSPAYSGTGIFGSASCVYKNNINITGCQFDGGVDAAVNLDGYNNVNMYGVTYGGGTPAERTTNIFTNQQLLDGQFAFSSTSTWGNYDTSIATGATEDVFEMILNTDYKGVYVELIATGLVKGVGVAITKATYFVTRASTGVIELTQLECAYSGQSTAKITPSTTIVGNTITFSVTVNSTSNYSTINSFLKIVGGYHTTTIHNL